MLLTPKDTEFISIKDIFRIKVKDIVILIFLLVINKIIQRKIEKKTTVYSLNKIKLKTQKIHALVII